MSANASSAKLSGFVTPVVLILPPELVAGGGGGGFTTPGVLMFPSANAEMLSADTRIIVAKRDFSVLIWCFP